MRQKLAVLANPLYFRAPRLYALLYSLYKRISDREERRLIAQCVIPGMNVIDVGANIGAYTRYFANLVGPTGRVIAIEPDTENFRRLCHAVAADPTVTAVHGAASHATGYCKLYISNELNVDHQTYDGGESRKIVTVPSYRIDDLVSSGTRVDFIKMDIQGAEPAAISGATRVLGENPGIALLFEYWPSAIRRSGHDPEQFLDQLRALDFELMTVPSHAQFATMEYCNILARRYPDNLP